MLKPNRLSASIAWSLCAITVALAVATIPLLFANSTQIADVLSTIPAFLAFAVGGALIVTHQPRNRVGWLYCVIGSSAILYGFALEYAAYALITRPHSLPLAMLLSWLGHDW